MKKFTMLFLIFVLTATIFTACGCRNSQPMNTTTPTTMPTSAPTTAPTETTTQTTPTVDATIEDGNGPLPTNATAGADGDTSSATEDTGMGGNSRSMPSGKASGSGTGDSGMGGNGMGGNGMGGNGMGGTGSGSGNGSGGTGSSGSSSKK